MSATIEAAPVPLEHLGTTDIPRLRHIYPGTHEGLVRVAYCGHRCTNPQGLRPYHPGSRHCAECERRFHEASG